MTEKQQAIIDFFAYAPDTEETQREIKRDFHILGTPSYYEAFAAEINKSDIRATARLLMKAPLLQGLTEEAIERFGRLLSINALAEMDTPARMEHIKTLPAATVIVLLIVVTSRVDSLQPIETKSKIVYCTIPPEYRDTPATSLTATDTDILKKDWFYCIENNIYRAVTEFNRRTAYGEPTADGMGMQAVFTRKTAAADDIIISLLLDEKIQDISPTARRLLNAAICTEFYNKETGTATIPLKEYMELCNLNGTDWTYKQAKKDMATIRNIYITATARRKGKEHSFTGLNLIQKYKVTLDAITIVFSNDIADLFSNDILVQIPRLYFSIDRQSYKYAAAMLSKIASHKNYNMGKANENTISVKSLIEACGLDATESRAAHFTRDTLKPFTANLDTLNSVLTWEFIGKSKTQIEEPNNWKEFTAANIRVFWNEYPNKKELLKAADKRKAKAKKTAKK